MIKNFLASLFAIALLAPQILFAQSIQVRTAAITGDTALYAAADTIGSKLSLTDPNTAAPITRGVIRNVIITDLAALTGNIDVLFFSQDPSATTFTNNAALDIADADLPNLIGSVALTDADNYADNSIMQRGTGVVSAELPFTLTAGSTLYAVAVARAGRTQATNNDLVLKVWIESR